MIKSFRKTDIAYSLTTLNNPCISESCSEVKSKLSFYFHTSLWCLKRPQKAFIKRFEEPKRSVKIKI